MAKLTRGNYGGMPQAVCGPDGSHPNWMVNTAYQNKEWATGIVTNYDVAAGQTMFTAATVPIARFVSIRTDAAITVRFNLVTNDAISIAVNTTFNVDTLEVSNIFLTATASATVKIFIT